MSLLMSALKVADDRKQKNISIQNTEDGSPPNPPEEENSPVSVPKDDEPTLEWDPLALKPAEQNQNDTDQWELILPKELATAHDSKQEPSVAQDALRLEDQSTLSNFGSDEELLAEYEELKQTFHSPQNVDKIHNNIPVESESRSIIYEMESPTEPDSLSAVEIDDLENHLAKLEKREVASNPLDQTTDDQTVEKELDWLDWLEWDEEIRPVYSDAELITVTTEQGEVTLPFTLSSASHPQAQRILDAGGKPKISKRTKWLYALAVITFIGVFGTIGGFYYKNLCDNQFILQGTTLICDTARIKKALLQPFQSKEAPPAVVATPSPTVAPVATPPPVVAVAPPPVQIPVVPAKKELPPPQETVATPPQPEPPVVKKPDPPPAVAKKSEPLPTPSPKNETPPATVIQKTTPKPSREVATVIAKKPGTTVTPESTPKVTPEESPQPLLRKSTSQQKNKKIAEAYQAFQQGRDDLARELYEELLHQDVKNRDALLGLAAIAARNQQIPQARYYYQQVLQFYPQDTLAQMGLNSVQLTQVPEMKESQLKLLVERLPEAPDLHFDLGNFYANQQQWTAAQQAYFNAYRLDKKQADYAYNLAISLDRLNQPQLALNYYQEAIKLIQNQSSAGFHFDPQAAQRRIQTLTAYTRNRAKND